MPMGQGVFEGQEGRHEDGRTDQQSQATGKGLAPGLTCFAHPLHVVHGASFSHPQQMREDTQMMAAC